LPGFVSSAELVGASLLAIGDAVVVNLGHAICLMYRVIRCCCRCAPDRGQATLLQGMCGVARICVERRICGSELARDRRRSRRKPGLCDLPDAPCHPILLPLRARSRASHAPTRDLWRCQNLCRTQNLWERGLSRDRRRSRRKPGSCGLPDVPRHPILLPLRARSRASHAPTRDLWRCQNCVDRQILWGAWLVPRSATQSS